MINLMEKEKEILSGLKDFQQATVDRVYELFTNEFSRVLVADEVGLGKTLIARGVIAKTARYHQEELKDPLFKVVYVCSNQTIARQNLSKLKIDKNVAVEDGSESRLSMQHLKIFENNNDPKLRESYIQLIPLTPMTSFNMTSGSGSVNERALIYAFIKRYAPLREYRDTLNLMMMDTATKSWERKMEYYDERVLAVDALSDGEYLDSMLESLDDYFKSNPQFITKIYEVCERIEQINTPGKRAQGANEIIYMLRRLMAEISVEIMDADLVIMDEFQRFSELINSEGYSETALLAKKFFNSPKSDEEEVKILLLSATPYKLYSTLEEISESQTDDHYEEFFQVVNFLFENRKEQQRKFKKVWEDYSVSLSEFTNVDYAVLKAQKQEAEENLYKGIARTERMLVDGAEELIEDRAETLKITEEDILSYINMDQVLQETDLQDKLPVDYVKSAPFLMSYMEKYKLKQKINRYFTDNPSKVETVNKQGLWVNRNLVNKYSELPETNTRLSKLKEVSLPKGAENLIWMPPSMPYYEFGGCYSGHSKFSKVLVFSAWEMVPRAIATLLSYESERLTVGKMVQKVGKKKKRKNNNYNYNSERRFPRPRLNFVMRENVPANMNHLSLIYPSVSLAKMFNPIEALNRQLNIEEIKEEIRENIALRLEEIPEDKETRYDERWYYMAPLLFDLEEPVMQEWFKNGRLLVTNEEILEKKNEENAFSQHFKELQQIYLAEEKPLLGKRPDDLVDVLVNMVVGSPGVCSIRMLDDVSSDSVSDVVNLAKTIVDRFNLPEPIAIVDLQYGKKKKDFNPAHWKNVLKYCVDGNFQAMLDEYAHMLLEEGGLKNENKDYRNNELLQIMSEAFTTHAASYNVDTFPSFKKRVKSGNSKQNTSFKMRTNYAVGFSNSQNETQSNERKLNVRLAFNSPFRPFVLATTSVGQEGLDFHYYCRKIVHWNLPSNPIDLEQREGRINRYKSFAIRQNIANQYRDIKFDSDVWSEMFEIANSLGKDGEGKTSELVPFWSLPENQGIKIERIVPLYPFSKDGFKYNRLMKILQLYRLSLGQARQEELLEYLFEREVDENQMKEMFMNLSPHYRDL